MKPGDLIKIVGRPLPVGTIFLRSYPRSIKKKPSDFKTYNVAPGELVIFLGEEYNERKTIKIDIKLLYKNQICYFSGDYKFLKKISP